MSLCEIISSLDELTKKIIVNDNGYMRCRACGGWWHLGDEDRHEDGCCMMNLKKQISQLFETSKVIGL